MNWKKAREYREANIRKSSESRNEYVEHKT